MAQEAGRAADENTSLLAHEPQDEYDAEPMELLERPKHASVDSESNHGLYSPAAGYAFMINYVLGVGVLGIPYAFVSAGIGFAVLFMLICTIVSAISMLYIVEACSRAEGLSTALGYNALDLGRELRPADFIGSPMPEWKLTTRKFEVNQLCLLFLGPRGRRFYEAALFCYMSCSLWSYAAVFASSLTEIVELPFLSYPEQGCDLYADVVPGVCRTAFVLYMLLFACIAIPLTCRDLTEQIAMQVALTTFRFTALGVMVITTIVAAMREPYTLHNADPLDGQHAPFIQPQAFLHLAGFSVMFTTGIYSQLLHHSTPGLAQPISKKHLVPRVFLYGFASTLAVYTGLGVICALYFGQGMQQVATLNWITYTGSSFNASQQYAASHSPWWAIILRYTVVLFPPIDIISAFPLNAITLGNNLLAALPPSVSEGGTNRRVKLATRLAAAIPPILLGIFIYRLSIILMFTGLSGFFIAFIIPSLLQSASQQLAIDAYGPSALNTSYSWLFSYWPSIMGVLFFGCGALAYALFYSVMSL